MTVTVEKKKKASYVRETGVGSCLGPALLQVVGPVEVLALGSRRPLQTHAVLQAPLDGQDARGAGVTHHGPRLSVNREVVQRDLKVDVVVDLRREKTAQRLTPTSREIPSFYNQKASARAEDAGASWEM